MQAENFKKRSRMLTLTKLSSLSAIFLLVPTAPATLVTIEQNIEETGVQIEYFEPLGQSFTAVEGQLLTTAFHFFPINPGFANDPVTVTLHQGEGLSGPILGTISVVLPGPSGSFLSSGEWIESDWSSLNIGLIAGEKYTLELDATTPYAGFLASFYDTYPEGISFREPLDGTFTDMAFRIGIWSSSNVPDSGSALGLMSASLAALAFVRATTRARRSGARGQE